MTSVAPTHPDNGGDQLAISVTEAARRLGISRAHAYRMVAARRLPSVRLGHRTVVPIDGLRVLLGEGNTEDLAS